MAIANHINKTRLYSRAVIRHEASVQLFSGLEIRVLVHHRQSSKYLPDSLGESTHPP